MQNDNIITHCSRCHHFLNDKDWSDMWPNYGKIHLGYASQAFAALQGVDIATEEHFKAFRNSHPAMTTNQAQEVIFEWGCGYRYDSSERYRLCAKCQKELLSIIGKFFGYGAK